MSPYVCIQTEVRFGMVPGARKTWLINFRTTTLPLAICLSRTFKEFCILRMEELHCSLNIINTNCVRLQELKIN